MCPIELNTCIEYIYANCYQTNKYPASRTLIFNLSRLYLDGIRDQRPAKTSHVAKGYLSRQYYRDKKLNLKENSRFPFISN